MHYIAPEIEKGENYNYKADIYSLGCIIYELFTLNEYYIDKHIDESDCNIDGIYNPKWQKLMKLLLQKDYHNRPNIVEVYELINKSNEITLNLKINKENIDKKIYFLDNTIEHNHLKEMNELNTEIYINEGKYNYEKFFIPKKEGKYAIKIIFNFFIKDCSYMFYNCDNITGLDLSMFVTRYIINVNKMVSNCLNLENVNISSFNSKINLDQNVMFSNCPKLNINEINFLNIEIEVGIGNNRKIKSFVGLIIEPILNDDYVIRITFWIFLISNINMKLILSPLDNYLFLKSNYPQINILIIASFIIIYVTKHSFLFILLTFQLIILYSYLEINLNHFLMILYLFILNNHLKNSFIFKLTKFGYNKSFHYLSIAEGLSNIIAYSLLFIFENVLNEFIFNKFLIIIISLLNLLNSFILIMSGKRLKRILKNYSGNKLVNNNPWKTIIYKMVDTYLNVIKIINIVIPSSIPLYLYRNEEYNKLLLYIFFNMFGRFFENKVIFRNEFIIQLLSALYYLLYGKYQNYIFVALHSFHYGYISNLFYIKLDENILPDFFHLFLSNEFLKNIYELLLPLNQ